MPGTASAVATEVTMIAWLDEQPASSTLLAGGKGASLSRMAAAGFPVPPGFVVCAAAFGDFLERSERAGLINRLTRDLDVNNSGALEDASVEIRRLILSGSLPAGIEQAIRNAYRKLGEERLVAVRSSAASEDGGAASFAGQQETFLNLQGAERVVQSVRECWASFFVPRAMYYRAHKGTLADTRMAVVVQEMILADKSGVLFTVDPVEKRRDHMMIEAVFGLGEGVVSGRITPDHYVVDRIDGSVVRECIAMQARAVVHNGNGGGTKEVELPEQVGGARVLHENELHGLREMGLRLEQVFGAPQDVEWCIRADELLLLQSRPITTL